MADLFQPALYLVHILLAGTALLAAFVSNLSGLSILLHTRPVQVQSWIRPLHILIAVCLVGLWVTGVILAGTKFTPDAVPVKVFVKLVLVTMLTVNSLLIGQYAARDAMHWQRPAVFHLPLKQLLGMVMCSSLSLTCWMFAFAVALQDSIGLALIDEFALGFVVVWALLAMAVTVLISVKLLLNSILFSWLRRGVSERKAVEEPPLDPAHGSLFPAGQTNGVATAAPETAPGTTMASITKGCTWAVSGVFGISFVTNLLMLTGPLFMLQIYDRVLTSKSIPTLTALLVLVAGLFFFLGVLELLRSRVLVRVGQRMDRQINGSIFQSIVKVESSTAKPRNHSLLRDLDTVRQFFSTSAPAALLDLPWTPLYFAVIFMFHWVLGLLAVAGAALLLAVSLVNELTSRKSVASAGRFATRSSNFVEAGRRNAEVLHAMGMFDTFRQRWLDVHRTGVSHHLKAADVSGTMSVISKVTRLFLQSLMLAGGAYYAVAGEISPGVIVAASIILSRALAPIEQIVGQWRNIIAVRQSYGRLSDALNDLDQDDQRIALPEPKGFLAAEHLYAGPLGSREPVLKDLNFKIGPGDAVAVVGSNACGKSTLARVLVGVWPALRGHVRLDGASLTQWLPQQLGNSVGYLPQDVELFEGTVAENISRFDPNATAEKILEAAKKAHVHDLVLRLPEGYATELGEGGVSISGGQRQRIALARALYGNPALVVLDEPNANLDNEGEVALTAAIARLREEGCAVVVVAHRPNVLSAVNLVLVLKDGRQVSFGENPQARNDNRTQVKSKPGMKIHAKAGATVTPLVQAKAGVVASR
ncbi:MAG: type I secretion system permease/ATPase [Pseudomonadota bacterium]